MQREYIYFTTIKRASNIYHKSGCGIMKNYMSRFRVATLEEIYYGVPCKQCRPFDFQKKSKESEIAEEIVRIDGKLEHLQNCLQYWINELKDLESQSERNIEKEDKANFKINYFNELINILNANLSKEMDKLENGRISD